MTLLAFSANMIYPRKLKLEDKWKIEFFLTVLLPLVS